MDYQDFQNIYDFTKIERGVQSQFVSIAGYVAPPEDDDFNRETWNAGPGSIPIYTAFQELTFQKCTPRLYFTAFQFSSIPGAYAIDANGNFREKAWTGMSRLGIVTKPNYTLHTQLRSQCLAIIPQIMPKLVTSADVLQPMAFDNTTGINAVLDYHEVSEFCVSDFTTTITPQDDYYLSMIPIKLSFSVKPSAWPAGMITQ